MKTLRPCSIFWSLGVGGCSRAASGEEEGRGVAADRGPGIFLLSDALAGGSAHRAAAVRRGGEGENKPRGS